MHWRDTDFNIYSIDWLKWHQLEKQPFGDKSINEFRILLTISFFYRSSHRKTTLHTHEIGMAMLDLWWWFKWNNQLIKLPFRYEEKKNSRKCDTGMRLTHTQATVDWIGASRPNVFHKLGEKNVDAVYIWFREKLQLPHNAIADCFELAVWFYLWTKNY